MILVPMPKKITDKKGMFHIDSNTAILLDASLNYSDFEAALTLRREIENMTGMRLFITKSISVYSKNYISLKVNVDKAIPSSSYKLNITEDSVTVAGNDATGLFYGIQTLRQVVRNSSSNISCLEIEDHPTFKDRGFYHDITRGRVPKLETLKELADRLSFYKINQLQLYIEHSFAFRKHGELWMDSDPMTAEEILELDEYCKARHIELVPSLSTFGHLYHALVSDSFRHLNEYENLPEKRYLFVDRMQHYTLDVSNPSSLEFVYDMIDEFLPLFSSDKFNICCDETFDLGKGRNKKLLSEAGAGKLYLYFVNNIFKHLKTRKKKVMMWGDIILKHPEIMNDLPKDVILLNWDYSSSVPEEGTREIAESGREQYVCPGVHGWNRFFSSIETARGNIATFAAHAARYEVRGILNTNWGDFGHINPLSTAMPSVIYGAALSWNPADSGKPSWGDISSLEYGDRSGRLVSILSELSSRTFIDWETVILWYYVSCGMSQDIYGYKDHYLDKMLTGTSNEIISAYGRILELKTELSSLHHCILQERQKDIREFLVLADGLTLFQALLLVIKKKFLGQSDTKLVFEPVELAGRLEHWFADYKRVWRESSKESELFRIKDVISGICSLLRN